MHDRCQAPLRRRCGLQIRVGDDRDRVLEVVEDDQRVREHQRHVWQPQWIHSRRIAERLDRAHQVVTEEADGAADERRPTRRRAQPRPCGPQRSCPGVAQRRLAEAGDMLGRQRVGVTAIGQ